MKKMLALALALCLLTGCAPLLERTYSTVEPHSSKFWESEAVGTLRAENSQDIVNDLLLLIGQHTENATLRLYDFGDDLEVADTLEKAAVEIQQETSLGAYAVEYITSSAQAQRGYYEAAVSIGYRRTTEQIQNIVNATSPEAVYSLLESALGAGKTELAVRIGYWSEDDQAKVESAVEQLREERELTETPMWLVNYYPSEAAVGLIEFLLDPPEQPPEEESEEPIDGDETAPPEDKEPADEFEKSENGA
jgi:hypothetical protein